MSLVGSVEVLLAWERTLAWLLIRHVDVAAVRYAAWELWIWWVICVTSWLVVHGARRHLIACALQRRDHPTGGWTFLCHQISIQILKRLAIHVHLLRRTEPVSRSTVSSQRVLAWRHAPATRIRPGCCKMILALVSIWTLHVVFCHHGVLFLARYRVPLLRLCRPWSKSTTWCSQLLQLRSRHHQYSRLRAQHFHLAKLLWLLLPSFTMMSRLGPFFPKWGCIYINLHIRYILKPIFVVFEHLGSSTSSLIRLMS